MLCYVVLCTLYCGELVPDDVHSLDAGAKSILDSSCTNSKLQAWSCWMYFLTLSPALGAIRFLYAHALTACIRRGRIGRGGRVIWDRVPVEAAPPARDDGLADPEDAPHFVHSNYVQFPFKPPPACSLHPPMVNLHVSHTTWVDG